MRTAFTDLVGVAFRHPIRLIANALGPPPAGLVERARKQGVAVAALVGQPRHAVRQIEAGVDLLIAQGTEAGGHTGTIATMVLTPEIVDIAAGRPVLAAGGIASGRQMAAALALGAAARAGHEGALRLESFFVGQVVGSFTELRPAGEITRQIVADCERRIAELADLAQAKPDVTA